MKIPPYERKVYYYETDQMAIVHHSNYLRWMEECRIDYMERMGFSYQRMEQEDVMIPVLEAGCVYKSMVRFGDTVIIQPKIAEYTGTRMTVTYEITDQATGELRTTGYTKHCFIRKSDHRLGSLKRMLPEAHEAFLASMEP